MFPIESEKRSLEVIKIEFGDAKDIYNFKKQKEIKLKNQSLTIPIKAHFVLKDKITKKKIDEKATNIIRLPMMTPRGSFVVDGNEYQSTYQMRLKAGVYTKEKNNGEMESQVNIQNMIPFKVKLDPETGLFTMKVRTSKISMYAFLKGIGVNDDYMEKFIGKELLEKNRKEGEHNVERALKYFSKHMTFNETDDVNEAKKNVREFFRESKMNKETTKKTLGKEFDKVSEDLILHTAKKLLRVTKGEEEEDDRDSLAFKKIMGLDDYLGEVVENSIKKVERSIKRNLDKHDEIKKIISPNDFNSPIKRFFTTSDLITAVEITNPISAIGNQNKITITGEGGIQSEQAISDDMININPSTFGFLDPVHTPESGRIGANLHLSALTRKKGNDLFTKVIDAKSGKIVEIKPSQLESSVVAFPDEYDKKNKKFKKRKVKVMNKREIDEVTPSKVDYILASSKGMFDMTTNLTPLLRETQGNRAMMGGKMQEQAISLKEREAPLVQAGVDDKVSFEKMIGDNNIIKAPVSGVIDKITAEEIVVKDSKGKKHPTSIYDNYPLGGTSMVDHEPVVKKGDKVKKGDLLADSNFTRNGEMALGKNMRVAFMTYKGYTFEDGLVVSESAADKFTSKHVYTEEIKASKDYTLDKNKFKIYFPNDIKPENDRKLDNDGIVKKGSKVEKGDVLIAAFKKKEVTESDILLNRIRNKLALDKRNEAIFWENDVEGTVKEVIKHRNLIKVVIHTEEPVKVGDKIVGRYGNKGTVTKIIPNNEMPKTEDGEDLDLLLNPHTVPSRMNPSQILETAAGKIAEKTGKPFIINNFENDDNTLEKIRKKMKELGIKEKEIVVDPKDGPLENPIFVGRQYMLKLQHQTKKKFSARSFNQGYDMDGQPLRGGETSGQAMDVLTNYSLLAHGAKANLKEMAIIKGTKNDEFWRAFQTGAPLPKPKSTPAFDKFVSYLQATGVKIEEKNDHLQLMAMTDKDVEEMSNGEIKNAQVIRAKNLQEYEGGLFDPKATGGKEGGEKWSHIQMEEPIPNPVFENPIKSLLGMKNKDYNAVLSGKQKLGGEVGGRAIKKALGKIDVKSELKKLEKDLDNTPKSKLNDVHKKIRYLKALDKTGRKPEHYVMTKIPVLPPKFRPIYELPNGSLGISDINKLYRHIIMSNDAIKMDKESGVMSDEEILGLSKEIYDSVGAMEGLVDPVTRDARQRNWKGSLRFIGGTSGTQPKDAFFQSKVVKKRQDLSGRATIIAGPELDVDHIGLPEKTAWEVYKPHIMKNIIKAGISPAKARNDHYEVKSPLAKKMLEKVVEEVPVILNRAPSLHKFSTMAFKPKLIEGKSIRLPSLVVTGFNADFDGDTMAVHVPVTKEAIEEANENLIPSKNLFRPGHGQFMLQLKMEQILGIYLMTKPPKDDKNLKGTFSTKQEALLAYKKARRERKKWSKEDGIKVGGKLMTIGQIVVNEVLPKKHEVWNQAIDKSVLTNIFQTLGKEDPKESSKIADKLKEIGNSHTYRRGFTIGLNDLEINKKKKNEVYNEYSQKLKKLKKGESPFEVFSKAEKKVYKQIVDDNPENAFVQMQTSGAKGNPDNVRQILAGPGLLTDNKGQVVKTPVTHSYAEGLDTSEYWTSMYGARKGMIDRAKSTADPGAFTKELINNTLDWLITERDCKTRDFKEKDLQSKAVKNRVLAQPVTKSGKMLAHKGDILDLKLIKDLKKHKVNKVKVRSPLICEADEGLCATCYGITENGSLPSQGENVGVIAGHAMTEPSTQMTMNSFHSGGVASNEIEKAQGLERLNQILRMPKTLPNKATLATVNGTVQRIVPTITGGQDVYINSTKHFVPPKRKLKVKMRQKVKKGDPISSGVIQPQELLSSKDVGAVRQYLADELYQTYGGDVDEKTLETVVSKVTNLTKVDSPGDSDYTPGQYAPLNKVNSFNKKKNVVLDLNKAEGRTLSERTKHLNAGTQLTSNHINLLKKAGVKKLKVKPKQIGHQVELKGINQLPLTNTDWLAKMNFNNIPKQFAESASTGAKSKVVGTNNPISAFAYGKNFGDTEGRY